MKRNLCVSLAIIILISAFSLNAFAFDTGVSEGIIDILKADVSRTSVQTVDETDTDASDVESTRTVKGFENFKNLDEFKISLTFPRLTCTINIKGEYGSSQLSGDIKEKHFYSKDSHYIIFLCDLLYAETDDGRNAVTIKNGMASMADIITSNYELIETYEEDGYYVEKFRSKGGNELSAYFDGERLVKYTELYGTALISEANFSYEVSDEDVAPPTDALKVAKWVFELYMFLFGWLI